MDDGLSLTATQDLFREILFNTEIEDRDDIYSLVYLQLLINSGETLEQLFFDYELDSVLDTERIKETTKLNRNTREQWKGKDCSICMSEIQKNEYVRTLGCTHYFHKKCVDRWFKTNMTCPMCRTNV